MRKTLVVAKHNIDVPQVKRIEFRFGIHVGDIIIEDHDIFCDGVNIAVRREGIEEPAMPQLNRIGACFMTQHVTAVVAAIFVAFTCGMSVWAVIVLPAETQVAIHWSQAGVPNGFVTVAVAASIGPALALVASAVCALLMWLATIVPDLDRDVSDFLAGFIAITGMALVVVFAGAHAYIMYGAIFGRAHGA